VAAHQENSAKHPCDGADGVVSKDSRAQHALRAQRVFWNGELEIITLEQIFVNLAANFTRPEFDIWLDDHPACAIKRMLRTIFLMRSVPSYPKGTTRFPFCGFVFPGSAFSRIFLASH
jgi:hypothetical protein